MIQDPENYENESNPEQSAYPTEERVLQKQRQKERKELKVKPRKQFVEEHFDDCGTDLSGLGVDVNEEEVNFATGLTYLLHAWPESNASPSFAKFDNLDVAFAALASHASSLDIIELCGGEARCSYIAIRRLRHLIAGDNFDLRCNCDLNDPDNQDKVIAALRTSNCPSH